MVKLAWAVFARATRVPPATAWFPIRMRALTGVPNRSACTRLFGAPLPTPAVTVTAIRPGAAFVSPTRAAGRGEHAVGGGVGSGVGAAVRTWAESGLTIRL